MNKKLIALIIGVGALVLGGIAWTAYGAPVAPSAGVGANPVNGYYLQTNGATSTWAAVSGGSGSLNGTGTAYYFPYWLSSSTLSATSSIFISSSTGNVGIGTTNPASALSVVSNSITTPTLSLNLKSGQTANLLEMRNANGDLILNFDASSIWRTPNSAASISMGGVTSQIASILNINTTLGGAGLTITGGSTKSADIILNRGTTSLTDAIYLQTNGANKWSLTQQDNATDNFGIYNFGAAKYVLTVQDTSGNVGIGTSQPSSTLHVVSVVTTTAIFAHSGTATTTVIQGTASSTACSTFYTPSGTAIYSTYLATGQIITQTSPCT